MQFQVEKRSDNCYYVVGLKTGVNPDCPIYYRTDDGFFELALTNTDTMQRALYDLIRIHENVKDGDMFATEFGKFVKISSNIQLIGEN